MIAGRINVALIWAHWSEILRVVASIRTGAVTASVIMRQLAPIRGRTGWRRAREQGRLERSMGAFTNAIRGRLSSTATRCNPSGVT